ncbi:MAG: polysaccharide biosynthesis/export family protein, partial [Halioglobus sp.]|nr:polysaccharide biosynthesis/export family protein [Halioglobus sp.]
MNIKCVCLLVALLASFSVSAQEAGDYKINSGDVLQIFVWNEEALTREVIVRSDGFVSIPLAGELRAGGQTPGQLTEAIATALGKYLNDKPVVTVSLQSMAGNIIYVLGKVNRP